MSKPTIGIDISKDNLDVHRWPDGESCRVSNDAAGHKTLIRWIGQEVECIAFESTGGYHAALEKALHCADLPVSKLNPTRVRRFAQAIGTQAKTDRVDARLIARMAATLEPAPQAPRLAVTVELHELYLARTALLRERTAAKNRAPGLTVALLKRRNATRLRKIEHALGEIDAASAALVAANEGLARKAEIICSIPSLGAVSAVAILAELPEIGTLTAAAVASLCGLAPFTCESGKWQGKGRIAGGRGDLRRAIYLPALTAARFNPDLKAVYDRLRAAGRAAAKANASPPSRKLV